jgi:hypothetical protein
LPKEDKNKLKKLTEININPKLREASLNKLKAPPKFFIKVKFKNGIIFVDS